MSRTVGCTLDKASYRLSRLDNERWNLDYDQPFAGVPALWGSLIMRDKMLLTTCRAMS